MSPGRRRALFLDRDGTLNVDTGYVHVPETVRLLPGAAEGVAEARRRGYLVVVVSNQSGVGRGFFGPEAVDLVNTKVEALLAEADPEAKLDGVYSCLHAPPEPGEDPCACRKPEPGLLLQAARELGIDLSASWMVGDKPSDVEAGRAAGTRTVYVSKDGAPDGADLGARDLAEAVARIAALEVAA